MYAMRMPPSSSIATHVSYERQLQVPRDPQARFLRLLRSPEFLLLHAPWILLLLLATGSLPWVLVGLADALWWLSPVLERYCFTREGVQRRMLVWTTFWPWRDVGHVEPLPEEGAIVFRAGGSVRRVPAPRSFLAANASLIRRMWREGVRGSGARRLVGYPTFRWRPGLILLTLAAAAAVHSLGVSWGRLLGIPAAGAALLVVIAGSWAMVIVAARERIDLVADGIAWNSWGRRRKMTWPEVQVIEHRGPPLGHHVKFHSRRQVVTFWIDETQLPRMARLLRRLGRLELPTLAPGPAFAAAQPLPEARAVRRILVWQAVLSLLGVLEWVVPAAVLATLATRNLDPVALTVVLPALAIVAICGLLSGLQRAWAARRAWLAVDHR